MANVQEITDANFESKVLKSELPFLLDMSAEWCGPCKIIGPIVEQIGAEYKDKLNVGVMDIDKNPATPARFSVMSIPTLILFKNGEVKEQIIGAQPKSSIMAKISAHLGE